MIDGSEIPITWFPHKPVRRILTGFRKYFIIFTAPKAWSRKNFNVSWGHWLLWWCFLGRKVLELTLSLLGQAITATDSRRQVNYWLRADEQSFVSRVLAQSPHAASRDNKRWGNNATCPFFGIVNNARLYGLTGSPRPWKTWIYP